MTKEEALKLLEAQGYRVEAPKTAEQLLQEKLDAQEKAFNARLEEMERRFSGTQQEPAPSRKSLVSGATANAGDKGTGGRAQPKVYTHGTYLQRQLQESDWRDLSDRTAPLPDWMNLEWAINEFGQLRMVQCLDRFGWPDQ